MYKLTLAVSLILTSGLWAQEPGAPPAPLAASERDDKCSVEGKVYSANNGQPLKKAEVQMRKAGGEVNFSATTDTSGHFAIGNLDPGCYTLHASRRGYVAGAFGGEGIAGDGTSIILTPGTKLKNIDIKLKLQGVVTGRVTDKDGEPAANIGVHLLKRTFANGKLKFVVWNRAQTNDKGEYRAFGLPPGKYCLKAVVPDGRSTEGAVIRSAKDRETAYVATYYPDALAPEDARQIEIVSGSELSGIDIRLAKIRLVRISGNVVNQGTSWIRDIQLLPLEVGGQQYWNWQQMRRTAADERGNFAFQDLTPGTYLLSTFVPVGGIYKSASTKVQVTDSDIEGVQLALGARVEVNGAVRVEGTQQLISQPLQILLASESTIMGPSALEVRDDGTFKLAYVAGQSMTLAVTPMPDGCYLKSIRIGDRNLEVPQLDSNDGVGGDMLITLSPTAAALTGQVKDAKGRTATGGVVVLAPKNRKRNDLFSNSALDQNGTYSIRNIRPGRYKIFAFDDAESGSYEDAEWLKSYEEKGESIELKESENATKDLKLIVTEGSSDAS
jgi:hypothetical protein